MTDDDIKAKWKQLQREPPTPYYGVPHRKLIELGANRPERGRFPIIGHGAEVERKLYSILNRAKEGSLSRLWAIGYDDSRPRSSQTKASADSLTQGSLIQRTLVEGQLLSHSHFNSPYFPNIQTDVCKNKQSSRKTTSIAEITAAASTPIDVEGLLSNSSHLTSITSWLEDSPRAATAIGLTQSQALDSINGMVIIYL